MRIAIMGAGAVGAYFGAKLAAAGHDLAFVARGEHLEALRRRGLRIDSADGKLHVTNRCLRTTPLTPASSILCFSASNPTTPTQQPGPLHR
jgi:2-dehydropantoate 2-reductase